VLPVTVAPAPKVVIPVTVAPAPKVVIPVTVAPAIKRVNSGRKDVIAVIVATKGSNKKPK
jgi:hypothetical protein